jgi:hypothetical protein
MTRKLILVSQYLLTISTSGCLFEPSPSEERQTGIDRVGTAESNRQVRVGQTTRDETLSILGRPSSVSGDGRVVEYTYHPVTLRAGFIAPGGPCGLCGVYPFSFHSRESLYLSFDPAGVLTRYASSRDPDPPGWRKFPSTR